MDEIDRMEFRHGRPNWLDHLLLQAREVGVDLRLAGDRVRFEAPMGAMSERLRADLTEHRDEIARALRGPEFRVHGPVESAPFLYQYRALFHAIYTGALGVAFTNSTHWVVRFTGDLDVAALVAAMRRLVALHPILGARVQMRAAVPVFVYSNDVSVYFADESQGEGDEPGRRTRALIDELVWGKFDLERDTLFRPFVVKVAAYTHVIGFVIHHLIGDLVSVRLVAQDIVRGYAGLPSESVESSLQYSDYLIGMGDWLLSTALRYRLDYWVRRLQGVNSCCLPPDFNVPPHECGVVRHEAVELAAAPAGELRELAGHLGVTLFTLCLAIYYCVLRRALAASDLVILVMHHGRDHPELAKLVGSFQNQIPVRIAAPAELGFAELARSIQEHCASASERRVPYGNIRHELERNRTPHVFPEFNFVPVAAASAVRHDQEDQFPLQAQPTTKPVEHATAEQYPYHVLDIAVMVSQVKLKCTYLDVLYRRDTIVKHLNLFGELASWFTRHPRGTVGGICEC